MRDKAFTGLRALASDVIGWQADTVDEAIRLRTNRPAHVSMNDSGMTSMISVRDGYFT